MLLCMRTTLETLNAELRLANWEDGLPGVHCILEAEVLSFEATIELSEADIEVITVEQEVM